VSNIKKQVVRQSKFRQTPTTGFYRYAATAHTIFAGSSNNRLACFDAAPHGGNVQRCLPHPVITSRSSVSETWLSAKFTVCLAFLPRFLYVHLAYKNMEPGQCNSSGFAMFFPISAMALMLALAQFLGIKPSRPVDPTCCSSLGAGAPRSNSSTMPAALLSRAKVLEPLPGGVQHKAVVSRLWIAQVVSWTSPLHNF